MIILTDEQKLIIAEELDGDANTTVEFRESMVLMSGGIANPHRLAWLSYSVVDGFYLRINATGGLVLGLEGIARLRDETAEIDRYLNRFKTRGIPVVA